MVTALRGYAVVPLLVAVLSACGGSHPPTSPSTSPSSAPPTTSAAPILKIDIKADAAGSVDPVASLSEVIIDVSGSTGAGLTYVIDFGDGFVATTATGRHIYAIARTFTVTCTVTDAQARTESETRQISVKTATGNWFQAGYVTKSARVEIRRLNITEQVGTSVRGFYRVTGDADRTIAGTLVPPRAIHLTTGDGVALDGLLPGRLNDDTQSWTLQSSGDRVGSQHLDFRVAGDPTSPPPDAVMKVTFGDDPAWYYPIPSVTPIRIDGSTSRGGDLTYFIEFGDGSVITGSQATQAIEGSRDFPQTARLTVIDRFGRTDSEELTYWPFALGVSKFIGLGGYWSATNDAGDRSTLRFKTRSGRTYEGNMSVPGDGAGAEVFATLIDDHHAVLMVPRQGIEYRGALVRGLGFVQMILVQHGGAGNGRTWTFNYNDDY